MEPDFGYDLAMTSAATIVAGVLILSALLGWAMLRGATHAELAEKDPKFRRRIMRRRVLWSVVVCVAAAVFCIVQIATKQRTELILSAFVTVLLNALVLIQNVRLMRMKAS